MGYRILVADGDPVQCEILAAYARECDAVCELVGNGEDALSKLTGASSGAYDLAFVDLTLSGVGGAAVAKGFRNSDHPDSVTLPIVGLAAKNDPLLFQEAYDAGMGNILVKPVSKVVVAAFFTALVEGRHNGTVFCNEAYVQALRLREERDRALEIERQRSYFFSTVSHDIRTPLNAIIGFSQMLSIGFADPLEERKAIDSIIVSGKTLLQLVNDILDLSKLEAGKMTIDPEPTDCLHVVDEIVESFRAVRPNSPVEIRRKAGAIPMVMVDPQRVRQILFNLVGNAVKFTERGHVEIRAEFMPTGEDVGTLRLDVEDTGCGIAADKLERIASPYAQFSRGAEKSGTGLGLAICRQLVKAMDGELTVKSEEGVGTVFTVVIPHVAKGDKTMRQTVSATQRMSVVSSWSHGGKVSRALVVDDSNVNIMVLKAMLARLGVEDVVTASNGKEALDILLGTGASAAVGPRQFDVVLTDLWMPGMDGEAMVKVVRAQPQLAQLPVYAVTADVEARKSVVSQGFTGILLKPITVGELRLVLNAVGRARR